MASQFESPTSTMPAGTRSSGLFQGGASDPFHLHAHRLSSASPASSPRKTDSPHALPDLGSAALGEVDVATLSKLLGMTNQDIADVLVQLDDPEPEPPSNEGPEEGARDASAVTATGRAQTLIAGGSGNRDLSKLRLETRFDAHVNRSDEALLIKARKADVHVSLRDEAGCLVTDVPLQLGICIVYDKTGLEVEELPNAGTEPLIEVLSEQQPWLVNGEATFEIKVNVLSSMRHGSLFRLCVFPAEVAVCEAHPSLCCTSKAIRTLCKKPRASPLPAGQNQDQDHDQDQDQSHDEEEDELNGRLEDQAKKISQLAQENNALMQELERLRAYLAAEPTGKQARTLPAALPSTPSTVFKRESKRAR
mmetsp:Transcript_4973/g.14670  ORF Transcript_4973/g.14670 Transcript_4973/m.14670 type:complete len:364 (+) Transcript_4973:129-1220(+)